MKIQKWKKRHIVYIEINLDLKYIFVHSPRPKILNRPGFLGLVGFLEVR